MGRKRGEGVRDTVKSKVRTRIWSVQKMQVSVNDRKIKLNECEGGKTGGRWKVRRRDRPGEAVEHNCIASLSGEGPGLLPNPHLLNLFTLVNILL